jgi:hypothetical protein
MTWCDDARYNSAKGLAQSKTFRAVRDHHRYGEAFGVRPSSGAFWVLPIQVIGHPLAI